jgi:UrcA family protein
MPVRSTLLKCAVVALAVVASAGRASSVAFAQDGVVYGARPGTKLQLVSYRDLNLLYPSHQSALNHRVGLAVRRVCSFDNGNIPIMDNDYRVCRDDAWGSARPQITNAINRAYYLARNGHSPMSAGYIMVDDR